MTPRRAEPLTQSLLNETILHDWFHPMENALEKVRYSDAIFQSLPMNSFILLGGLRQLLSINSLREHVQTLFHLDSAADRVPVPRSTGSDAMASSLRRDILRQGAHHLVTFARTAVTDKLSGVDGIDQRPVLAIDVTYQEESSHYQRVLPKEGGTDNQKGVRPSQVVNSSGCKSRSGKAGQLPDSKHRAGGVTPNVKHNGRKPAGRKRKLK